MVMTDSSGNAAIPTICERIELPLRDIVLKGKVYRPVDLSGCKGVVIFTHGLGYCDRQYKISGEYFAQNNYLMFIYNLRGHAGTPGTWSLQAAVDDLIECIDGLTAKYKFPHNERICVIGHSTGGLITLLAALKDKRIKFGSLVTLVTCLTDSYKHWFKSGFNQDVKEFFKTKGVLPVVIENFLNELAMLDRYRRGEVPVADMEISHRYGLLKSDRLEQFFHEIVYSDDVLKHVAEIKIPLLLFRGEQDEVMDVYKTNELYEKLNERIPTRLYITDSKNHFHNDRWDLIQKETLKFFDIFCTYSANKCDISKKSVLIIDDDILVAKTLQIILRRHGIADVIIAESGNHAMQLITTLKNEQNRLFDLIISDIRMPGVDGIDTIRKVRDFTGAEHAHNSAVIFITGFEGDGSLERARGVGYVDYLRKPIDADLFLASVRKQLSC